MSMVATLPTSQSQVATQPPSGNPWGRLRYFHLNRRDVELLIKAGVIPEDATTELLGGLLVYKDRAAEGEAVTTIGNNHRVAVERLSGLRSRINSPQRHVESQQPLVCADELVPEPDMMVLRGVLEDYTDFPTAADAYCVVEVADSSYERDTVFKLEGYARGGVAQYVVINLRNRTAAVYINPDRGTGVYDVPQIIPADGVLALRIGDNEYFSVALADVLP